MDSVFIDGYNYSNLYQEVVTKEKVEEMLQDYDKERLFGDDILTELLKDKIEEKAEKLKKEEEEREIQHCRDEIDSFISKIKKVIFSDNKTIILWDDGVKTIVSCQDGEVFDREKGVALCIIKYMFGNIGYYNEIFKALNLNEKKDVINLNVNTKTSEKRNMKALKSFIEFLLLH